jgi:hypothetical protein
MDTIISQFEDIILANDLIIPEQTLSLLNVFLVFSEVTTIPESESVEVKEDHHLSFRTDKRTKDSGSNFDHCRVESFSTAVASTVLSAIETEDDLTQSRKALCVDNTGAMDFSGCMEAFESIGIVVKEVELYSSFEQLMDPETQLINYEDCKQLFLNSCSLQHELSKRGMEDQARQSAKFAREALFRALKAEEEVRRLAHPI